MVNASNDLKNLSKERYKDKETISRDEQEIIRLRSELSLSLINDSTSDRAELKRVVSEPKNDNLAQKVEEYSKECFRLQAENSKLNLKISKLEEDKIILQSGDNTKLKSYNDQVSAEKKALDKRLEARVIECEGLRKAMELQKLEIDQLKANSNFAASSVNTSSATEVDELKNQILKLTRDLEDSASSLEKLDLEVEQLKNDNKFLKDERDRSKESSAEDFSSLKREIGALKKDNEKLFGDRAAMDAELTRLKKGGGLGMLIKYYFYLY